MPISVRECPDHGEYESLIGMTYEADDVGCPECGVIGKKLIAPAMFQMGLTCQEPDQMDPGTRTAVLKHKKYLSDNKDKIDSGEIGVKIQGPAWSIPKELQ